MNRKYFLALLATACMGWAGGSMAQQGYPERPVTLVLGFAPGGPADTAARLVAEGLTKRLGQAFVVENRPGAVGTIAAGNVARAAPDGYTILIAAQSTMAIAPHTFASIPFDPLTSFAPITTTIHSPWVLMVSPTLPVNNLAELIEHAKKNPGQLNYGSIGRGGSHNFVSELFKQLAGVDLTHIAYKGSADAHIALRRGDIHVMFDTMPSPIGLLADGRVKGIAITGAQRSAVLPSLPTFGELSLPQMDATSWFSLVAPARTPDAVIQKVNEAAVHALAEPDVQETLRKMGLQGKTMSTREFADFLASESRRWQRIIESTNFKKE